MGKHVVWLLVSIIVCLGLIVGPIATTGCGGGGVTTGCVKGWVFTGPEGDLIIGSDRVPPEGYEPVEGATVQIEGYPNLTDTTDANGEYLICCVPPGSQVIVVTVGGEDVRFAVQVVAGEIVVGGGHIEGGGLL